MYIETYDENTNNVKPYVVKYDESSDLSFIKFNAKTMPFIILGITAVGLILKHIVFRKKEK